MKHHKKYFEHTSNIDHFHQQTNIDINLEEVYNRIDFTASAYGRQYFYKYLFSNSNSITLGTLLEDQKKTESYNITDAVTKLEECNTKTDFSLIDLFFSKLRLNRVDKVLSLVSILFVIIGVVGISFHIFFAITFIVSLFINAYFYHWRKQQVFFQNNSIKGLNKFSKAFDSVGKLNIDTKGVNNNFIIFPSSIKIILSFLSIRQKDNWGLNLVQRLLRFCLNLDFWVYYYFSYTLKHNRDKFIAAYDYVGYIDFLNCITEIKKNYNTCSVKITSNSSEVNIVDGYHPLIDSCVPNTFTPIYKDTVISGINKSGKTFFLKQIAVNVKMGQKLGICFAKEATIPNVPICTYLSSSGNMIGGINPYYAQLARMKNIMEECRMQSYLVIVDNAFKHSNQRDQVAINYSILQELSKMTFMLITTTNDSKILDVLDRFNCYYFEYDTSHADNYFSYSIKEGKQMYSNSARLAKDMGFSVSDVNDAQLLLNDMDHRTSKSSIA